MNRQQRRASKGKRFVAKCNGCDAEHCDVHVLDARAIYADDPNAPEELGICKGCPCAVGMCDACGETGGHWLGCSIVGLPEGPSTQAVLQ